MDYKCWYCRKSDNGKLMCSDCEKLFNEGKLSNKRNVAFVEIMHLPGGEKCTRTQYNEINRRVILNDNGQTYDVGRRGENGKIQERSPDFL